MATLLSTLYPPLVDTFMPAFPNESRAAIDFSVSPYNSSYEIQYLHVTLVNQKTNKNAFGTDKDMNTPAGTTLINGVWIIPFTELLAGDTNPYIKFDRNNNQYTLYIPPDILKKNEQNKRKFVVDSYYKVQLRFDKYIESGYSPINSWNSNYLSEKRAYFSEWSSVCLVKAIPTITIHLNNFTPELSDYLVSNTMSITNLPSDFVVPKRVPQYLPGIIPIAGNLTFEGYDDSGLDNRAKTEYYQRDIRTTSNNEYLMSYRIRIKDKEKNLYVDDSKVQYTSKAEKTNSFYWLFDLTEAEINKTYTLELTFTTNNQYTFTKDFEFVLIEPLDLGFNPQFNFHGINLPYYGQEKEVIVTCEDGWVELSIENQGLISPGFLFIKRRVYGTDKWELIRCVYVADGEDVTCTVIDKTISSLVGYQYGCQYLTAKGSWTEHVTSPIIIYPDFHDILLTRGNKQLAIRYNAQITNLNSVTSRVKIDTLGSKYPRFAENAKLKYKQFQLNGMIIAESDYNRKFLSDLDYSREMALYNDRMNGKYLFRNDTVRETELITVPIEQEDGTIIEQTYTNGTYSQDIAKAAEVENNEAKGNNAKRRTQLMGKHDIYPFENWWWERKFREEALEWLNDGEPKLYRSMTEGNMIVMVDAITLTPNAQLGRRVWNFSCTIYEVGDGNSLEELDALGIYKVENSYSQMFNGSPDIDIDTPISRTLLGQTFHVTADVSNPTTLVNASNYAKIYTTVLDSNGEENEIIIPSIAERIGNLYQGLYQNWSFNSNSIKIRDLRIQFESLPQWYDLTSLSPNADTDIIFEWDNVTIMNDQGQSIKCTLQIKLKDGAFQVEVVKAVDQATGQSIDTDNNKTINEFLNNWENQIANAKNKFGNNLFKINLDSGESISISPSSGNDIATDKIIDAYMRNGSNLNNYGLGYKLKLNLVSPHDPNLQLERVIFVNSKGYYQVPSNLAVKEITLFDGATATLDYILEYYLRYDDVTEPNSYEITENIVGQVSGEWDWKTSIQPLIYAKYYSHDVDSTTGIKTEQMVDYWKAVSFDGTPYTILYIQPTSDTAATQYIVGRSGILNLQTEYPTKSLWIGGKRMVQAPKARQDYLDEWEYVLDNSVYSGYSESSSNNGNVYWWFVYNYEDSGINSGDWTDGAIVADDDPRKAIVTIQLTEPYNEEDAYNVADAWYTLSDDTIFDKAQIFNPKPNTIYGIINTLGEIEYKIYYLDYGWFNVDFPNIANNDYSIAYARVPIYGMFDYRASILKKMWDPPTQNN